MKKALVLALMIFGMSSLAKAQTVITDESMTHDGTTVTVSFNIDTDVKGIPSRRKEVIMPYIYNGKDTLWMDVVEVYGKGRYKRERQENHINGDKDWELADNQTLKGDIYVYEDQVPLKRWMKSANLSIKRQLVGCACEKDQDDENIAEGVALFEEPQMPARRTPAYALNEVGKTWDFGQDELEIIFKVSKIEIDSTVFNNEVTFGKILEAVDKIYTNPNYIKSHYGEEIFKRFDLWLAHYANKAYCDANVWQYGDSGKVTGISGNVDMNRCYVDYPAIIKGMGNQTTEDKVPEKSVNDLAQEVIAGKWGAGEERKKLLGDKYNAVQAEVNCILSGRKTVTEIAKEVIQGKWGVGANRRRRLTAAGYDYFAVQKKVNSMLR